MKRRISLMMAVVLLLSLVFAIPVSAAEGDLGSGTPDGKPPVLQGITLSVTNVKAPGTIEITVDATDDVSGVEYAYIWFYCEETRKDLYCSLSTQYYDEETWQYVTYADGKLHGKLEIDQYVETGTFFVEQIELRDVADNYVWYTTYNEEGDPFHPVMPESVKNLQFTVTDEDMPDSAAPKLNSIVLSQNTVNAPGTIEVTVDATDDVSGVEYAYIWFYCEETRKDLYCSLSNRYYDEETWQYVTYADGKLHGKLEIDQYVETGTFFVEQIELRDVADNYVWYTTYNEEGDPFHPVMPDTVKNLQFDVIASDTPDSMPPILKNISVNVDTMKAPGTIEVTVDATDDVSGVEYAYIWFYCEETRKDLYCSLSNRYYDDETWEYVTYSDGKLHGKLEIDQYVESGTFVVEQVELRDVADNYVWYTTYNEEGDPYNPVMPDNVKNLTINILNAIPDVTTSVSKSEFVAQVEQAEDNAYIVADYSGEATLPEETFDAIAGTDKTVDLVSEGVTWRFNGNDIVNESKPIDLNVQISKVEENATASSQEIQEKLEETPAVVMKFAENGQLPGKATIQVKVDYAMRDYLGADKKLCVYYYNNQTGELELVARDLTVINDTYVEFSITHCSYYVLTTMETASEDAPSDGWAKENGNWVFYENGVKVTDAWRKDSIGWCYLGSNGAMLTNTWLQDSKGWCYIGADGYCETNCWKQDSYGWLYLDSEGSMTKNSWILDGGRWYYLDADGYMVTDAWRRDSYGWCYLGGDGAMKTNCWLQDSKGWCYIGADGYCETNCWKQDSYGWLYLDSEGSMTKDEWILDNGDWYYLDEEGYMVTGEEKIHGTWYTFNDSGVWIA